MACAIATHVPAFQRKWRGLAPPKSGCTATFAGRPLKGPTASGFRAMKGAVHGLDGVKEIVEGFLLLRATAAPHPRAVAGHRTVSRGVAWIDLERAARQLASIAAATTLDDAVGKHERRVHASIDRGAPLRAGAPLS
jgi:hypothetical protein